MKIRMWAVGKPYLSLSAPNLIPSCKHLDNCFVKEGVYGSSQQALLVRWNFDKSPLISEAAAVLELSQSHPTGPHLLGWQQNSASGGTGKLVVFGAKLFGNPLPCSVTPCLQPNITAGFQGMFCCFNGNQLPRKLFWLPLGSCRWLHHLW